MISFFYTGIICWNSATKIQISIGIVSFLVFIILTEYSIINFRTTA